MFVPRLHLATPFALGALVACSGPSLPEAHHALVVEPTAEPPEAAVEAPPRMALDCPPEPEDDADEMTGEPVEEEGAESAFDVEEVVRRALGEHARCAPNLFAGSSFLQEYGTARIATHAGVVEVDAGSSGGGVYGGSDVFFALIDPARCRPLVTVETGWNDGALMSPAVVSLAPARDVVRLLQGSTHLHAFAHTAPEAGLVQLLMRRHANEERLVHVAETFELRGPLFAPGPTFTGTPHPSEVGYLVPTRGLRAETLRAQLAVQSEGEEEFEEDEEEEEDEAEYRPRPLPAFIRVMGVENVVEDYPIDAFIVRSFRMLGRNQGALVALINTTSNTYRWVLETRAAVLGSSVQWRGAYRGFLVGEYHSDHPGGPYTDAGGVVLLRLTDGAVFELDIPGVFERGQSLLSSTFEEHDASREQACVEETTRAVAASTGYTVSVLEEAPWWCRENEVLVRLRTEIERTCVQTSDTAVVRVEGAELEVRTLAGTRSIRLDAVIDAVPPTSAARATASSRTR